MSQPATALADEEAITGISEKGKEEGVTTFSLERVHFKTVAGSPPWTPSSSGEAFLLKLKKAKVPR